MNIYDKIFQCSIYDKEKLLRAGALQKGGNFIIKRPLSGGFSLTVLFGDEITFFVTDDETGEPYTLYLVEEVNGGFVGRMREEIISALVQMSREYCTFVPFQSEEARALADYVTKRYGEAPDFPWADDPFDAVIRRSDNKKWYATIFSVKGKKVGLNSDAPVEITNVRIGDRREEYLNRQGFVPAWHMNKTHWITVRLDGSVPFDDIITLVDESRRIAERK